MSWSARKKRIEERFAKSLAGRVSLFATRSRTTRGSVQHCGIRVDGNEIISGDPYELWNWVPDSNTTCFSSDDFHHATLEYLDLSIEEIISSSNFLIRALGMLDGRMGKRRLRSFNPEGQPELVIRLWQLRCSAEKISYSDDGLEDSDLSQRIKIPKLWKDLWKVNALGEEEAEVILEKNKINQNIPMLLRRMKSGMVDRGDLVTPIAEVIFAGHCLADNGTEFRDHVEYLSRASSLFEQTDCARGTVELLLDHRSWIRQLNDWRPRSYNPEKQFRSLAQHLLAKFEVPMFMDQAWTKANQTHQEWFKHVAGGKNISTARGFPKSMTKRAAHFFMQAPPQYSITDAIRYGQILSLGGDRRLCDVVIETRLGQTLEHDDFWLTVLRFFVRNPMLDPLWIGPIIDYIHYRRFEPILEAGEDGLLEERPPLQPDFSISGRSVAALLRMVQVWHGELANAEDSELRWAPSGISGFNLEANSEADLFDILRRPTQAVEPIDINNHWRIRELLSSAELIAEGKNLRHCVASYARSCHQGQCSIWTLELQSELFRERRVTIEVNPKTRHIRQVRGLKNRYATDEEKRVIKLWSVREDLIY